MFGSETQIGPAWSPPMIVIPAPVTPTTSTQAVHSRDVGDLAVSRANATAIRVARSAVTVRVDGRSGKTGRSAYVLSHRGERNGRVWTEIPNRVAPDLNSITDRILFGGAKQQLDEYGRQGQCSRISVVGCSLFPIFRSTASCVVDESLADTAYQDTSRNSQISRGMRRCAGPAQWRSRSRSIGNVRPNSIVQGSALGERPAIRRVVAVGSGSVAAGRSRPGWARQRFDGERTRSDRLSDFGEATVVVPGVRA